MRRRLAALLAGALLAASASAQQSPPPLPIDPARQVYAFDQPAVLVSQIVFGLAHGVTLLARACLDTADDLRQPAQQAYEEWLMRYGERLVAAEQTLARHYFGERADEATEEDLARALNLPPQLALRQTPERLYEACRTFPEALAKKRYNLDLLVAAHRDEQRLARAVALRAQAAQCRDSAAVDLRPAIDAAFERWQRENAGIEEAAQQRWLKFRGDEKAWAQWQAALNADARRQLRAGADGVDAACQRLAAELAGPGAALARILAEPAAPVETTAAVETAAETPPEAVTANRVETVIAGEAASSPAAAAPETSPQWLILLGGYASRSAGYLRSVQARLTTLGIPNFTENTDSQRGARTWLRAGPFPDRAAAEAALARLRGHVSGGLVAPRP